MPPRFDPKAYRASRAAEYAANAAAPVEPQATGEPFSAKLFKPFYETGVLTADEKQKEQQSLTRRVGEDALTLGLVPSALVATVPDLVTHPIKTAERIGVGFVDGVIAMFDAEEWKKHPLLNLVNTVANITVVGGLVKSAALSTVRNTAMGAAREAALKAGADATLTSIAFKSSKAMKASIFEAVKIGSTEPVISTARTYFKRAGLADEVAEIAARDVAETAVGTFLKANKGKLAAIDAVAHPVQAFGKYASTISKPIQELILGTPERSAVGKLYGSEVVAKDVQGFGLLEDWAGMQTLEKGWKNTVENRVRVMEDWVDQNPEYAALTAEKRVQHFREYAQADLIRQRTAQATGREYVLTKALPEHYVEAMTEYASTLDKNLTNAQVIEKLVEQFGKDFGLHAEEVGLRLKGKLEVAERAPLIKAIRGLADDDLPVSVTRLTKAEQQIVSELKGSGYRIGRAPKGKPVSQAATLVQDTSPLAAEARKYKSAEEFVKAQISSKFPKSPLSNERLVIKNGEPISALEIIVRDNNGGEILLNNIRALEIGKGAGTEALSQLKKVSDETGYRISGEIQPTGNKILNVKQLADFYKKNGFEVIGKNISYKPVTKSQLTDFYNKVTKPVDVLAEKTDLLATRTALGRIIDNLGLSPQGIVEGTQFFQFREAFTQGVLKKFGTGKTMVIEGVKYPVESLAFVLEKLRKAYMDSRSGVLPPIFTIADLRYRDLVKLGFSKSDAKALDSILRESNVTSPAVTGIGEAFSNYIRTRNNPLSRSYSNFLRWQSDYRFKKNPMFALQAAVESVVWGNMWTKTLPGKATFARALSHIPGLKKPLIEAGRQPTMLEQSLVLEEVLGDYSRQLRDVGMSPEIYRGMMETAVQGKSGIPGVIERLKFESRNVESNIWLGAARFSTVKLSTNLMRTYAKRFGFESLEEALASKMVNGSKVYENPWLVENMRSAAQAVFGYKAGVLTSPLIRTLNTVFFPIRFETKTMIQTAKWFGSLSPMSRLVAMNQIVQTAHWLNEPEGQQWRKKNRGLPASFFNYVFAFEGIGKTVDAATRGQLFGGNTGLIGGLPFGFIATIARDLGYTPEDRQINLNTGLPYTREIVRDPASFSSFVVAVEDILTAILPSMPLSTASGGVLTASLNRTVRDTIEQIMSATAAEILPGEIRDYKVQKIKVRPEYQRRLPNPLDIFSAQKAEAAGLPSSRRVEPISLSSGRRSSGMFSQGFFEQRAMSLPNESKAIPVEGRGVTVGEDELAEAANIVFSEVSNRSPERQAFETRVILNTAFNRMKEYAERGITKSLTDVLHAPNQYQGYDPDNKKSQYVRAARKDFDELSSEKYQTVLDAIEAFRQEGFPDNTDGSVYYIHNTKTGQIFLKPGSLFAT